jgi:FkbM family methyltransferase
VQRVLIAAPGGVYSRARQVFGLARYFARRPHEEDFRYFRRFAGRGGLFLDVGANSGNSALAYRLMDRSSRIISFEPNPFHETDLKLVRCLIGEDFSYRLVAAGAEAGTSTLHIPFYRSTPLTGDASLDRDEALRCWTGQQIGVGDRLRIEEVRVPVEPIDALELDPHAVKIDVEGAEPEVLDGMRQTLERCRPDLMIEASPKTPQIAERLAKLGYEASVYNAASDSLTPWKGEDTLNVFFVSSP